VESNVKYWEIIADRLSKSGWSWGCVAVVNDERRGIPPFMACLCATIFCLLALIALKKWGVFQRNHQYRLTSPEG
jgi:hypothetical protein